MSSIVLALVRVVVVVVVGDLHFRDDPVKYHIQTETPKLLGQHLNLNLLKNYALFD